MECPVCLHEVKDAVTTQCGHPFCSACLQESLRRSEDCPMCRTRVTMVLPLHVGGGNEARADREFLRNFNRVHEPEQGVREQVFILRQYNPLVYIVPLVFVFLYFISSVDLIPDSVPVVGLLDDLFFLVFVLVGFSWLTRRYRDNI